MLADFAPAAVPTGSSVKFLVARGRTMTNAFCGGDERARQLFNRAPGLAPAGGSALLLDSRDIRYGLKKQLFDEGTPEAQAKRCTELRNYIGDQMQAGEAAGFVWGQSDRCALQHVEYRPSPGTIRANLSEDQSEVYI